MHELPITESLLELAVKHAEEAGAKRISRLNVVIGDFSSVVDDSVQFYFDILSKDTMAEGAKLHFTRIPAKFQCLVCGNTFAPGSEDYLCPDCGSHRVKVIQGREFRLESIDVE